MNRIPRETQTSLATLDTVVILKTHDKKRGVRNIVLRSVLWQCLRQMTEYPTNATLG